MNKTNHSANLPMTEYLELVKLKEQDEFGQRELNKALFELIKKLVVAIDGPNALKTTRFPVILHTDSFTFVARCNFKGDQPNVSYARKSESTDIPQSVFTKEFEDDPKIIY